MDPDIIAALDDDFDFGNTENELEDNFMELANQGETEPVEGEPTEEDLEGLFSSDDDEEDNGRTRESDDEYEDEMGDSVRSLKGPRPYQNDYMSDDEDENKSRFTDYSMSSSVVRRNKQLLLVDDCFEKVILDFLILNQ